MENKKNVKYWSLPVEKVLEFFQVDTNGLTSDEAKKRLLEFGINSIKAKKKTSALFLFLSQFKNPIIVILIVATLISAATGERIEATIIISIVLGSAVLSFFQEYSASNAIAELRAKVQAKTMVLRDDHLIEISSKEIVPGDIIKLSTGSLVPADSLLLETTNFFVNQSILTGESFPSEKKVGLVLEDVAIADRTNCVYMGTNVQSGNATALVIETGQNTQYGEIAKKLNLRPPETEFERGVRHFGYLLTRIMLILTLAVFAINVFYHRPAIDSLLFSVALAVGITPQLLPAIISITLSMGSRSMAKAGVIVRRLNAIENFGSMDVLCTDKTGTLTQGIIQLDGAVDYEGNPSDDIFRLAYINAKLQVGMSNTLDQTIINSKELDINTVEKHGEIPYDFVRRRLSVVVLDDGQYKLIAKGAFDNVLAVCTEVECNGTKSKIDDELLNKIKKSYYQWSDQGIRVLGVAQKSVPSKDVYSVNDEYDMVFMGFLLLFDHPKADVAETIESLKDKGVNLKVITGDNKLVALHTALAVGLEVTGVLTGSEIMKLTDDAFLHRIQKTNLFAEIDPNQKERIIRSFKKLGHVVGYMGDGINDVPALHAADVSLSVNNAVDVAKESADFVLMENSLKVLNAGIVLGRTTFSNTLKYILVTTSANFGNMFSMAGASLFLPFLPLLPKQILMINFLTDFPAIYIASDFVDPETLEKPRRWDINFIKKFMFTFGIISSVFDYLTFALLIFVFKAHHGIFQSSWFLFSILTELLVLLIMRTHRPFFKSKPAPTLLYSVIIVGIITLLIPYLPFINTLLTIQPISLSLLAALFGLVVLYILTTEVAKHYFYRKNTDSK